MALDLGLLETDRLRVRPFAADDLDTIAPILDRAFGEQPRGDRRFWLDWSVMNYRALAEMYQPPFGDRAIVRKADDRLIGSVGVVPAYGPFETLPSFRARLHQPPNRLFTPEIGLFWALDEAQRGQGYATEAARAVIDALFTRFDLKRVVAATEYDNHASIAVMRRLGMTIDHNPDPEPAWFQVVGILENGGA